MLVAVSICIKLGVFDKLVQSQSKARVMNLRFQLQTLKKGSLSIDEFVLKMKTIAESLHDVGHVLSDDDLVMHLLGGLGPEYDVVVVNLTTRNDLLSLLAVHSILQVHEMRLLQSSSNLTLLSLLLLIMPLRILNVVVLVLAKAKKKV